MLIYKPITTNSCYEELQQDINNIFQWSVENLMSFNISKCKCMLLTHKRDAFCPTMMLNNQSLEIVTQYKYLGIIISSNLCWSQHIQEICMKARRMLGIIYRNYAANMVNPTITLRLYVTLVRPCLEYAAQVWNPHLTKDINNLQKFALMICSKRYHDSYESLLDLLEIPILRNRRLYLTLCTFYKIINELVYFLVFHHATSIIKYTSLSSSLF